MIDAGTFQIQYDEDRKQYFVQETHDGRNAYCDDMDDLLHFIEHNTWAPEE